MNKIVLLLLCSFLVVPDFPLSLRAENIEAPPPPVMSVLRTPPVAATPRINGPRVYGAKPGHPFFYHLPVTGARPMTIMAEGLPAGLSLDPSSGNITGVVSKEGDFSQGGENNVIEWASGAGSNLWRTTPDISADWNSISQIGFSQNGLEKYAGPGHWNDPDMLEIGNGHLTPDENYTHMTLWCILSAPLIIGCDMRQMTALTLSILSNDELIAVDQDALGRQGWRVKQEGGKEVWMKPLKDGSLAVAFFNRDDASAEVSIRWADLKLTGPQAMRDLWRQKELGVQASGYTVKVAPHGAELYKISPSQTAR